MLAAQLPVSIVTTAVVVGSIWNAWTGTVGLATVYDSKRTSPATSVAHSAQIDCASASSPKRMDPCQHVSLRVHCRRSSWASISHNLQVVPPGVSVSPPVIRARYARAGAARTRRTARSIFMLILFLSKNRSLWTVGSFRKDLKYGTLTMRISRRFFAVRTMPRSVARSLCPHAVTRNLA